MEPDAFDEERFFGALAQVRCMLIGRRALVALGLPVLTADYDLWLHIDDIEELNRLVEPLALRPTRDAEAARKDLIDLELLQALRGTRGG